MHNRNIPLFIWTINDPKKMVEILDNGIDAIFTDKPDLLLDVISRRKTVINF